MTNKQKWLVLSVLFLAAAPFGGTITGQATGTTQVGCGEAEELLTTDTQEVRRQTAEAQNCIAGLYFYDGVAIDFDTTVVSGDKSSGTCVSEVVSQSKQVPLSVTGECKNGRFVPDVLEKCKAAPTTSISCADFESFSESIERDFQLTKLSPFEFRLKTARGEELKLDFRAPVTSFASRAPEQESSDVVELVDILKRVNDYDSAQEALDISELIFEFQREGVNLSPLALERTACIYGLSLSQSQPSKLTMTDSKRFSDKCLWLAPHSPECTGAFNIENWAQHGRYHPMYLANWKDSEAGFQSTGFSGHFDNASSSSWNELELNYGPSGRLLGNAILDYQGGFTPSDYLSAVAAGAQAELDTFSERNDERNRTLYRRSFQGSLLHQSSGPENNQASEELKDNLVITGDLSVCNNEQRRDTDLLCLPSPVRIFVGTRNPFENAESAAVFRIQGYKKVTIEDLDLEILPHPDMAWVLPDPVEACGNTTCTVEQKRALLEYFLPDHYYSERWNQSSMIFQAGDSSSVAKINSLMFGKLKAHFTQSELTEYLCDSAGGTANVETSGPSLDGFIDACFSGDVDMAYARIWDIWTGLFDMHKRMTRAGEGFYIFDNDSLVVRNTRIRAVVGESVFQLHANRYQQFDNVMIEGMPAARISQLNIESSRVPKGLSLMDVDIGFTHFHSTSTNFERMPLEEAYYLGNGIKINNGVNVTPLPPGANCCADATTGELKTGCSPSITKAQTAMFDHTNHSFRASCEERASSSGTDPFLCENQWTTITNVTVQNCTTGNLKTQDGRGYSGNFDGLAFMSANGLLFNSAFKNFRYDKNHSCDTLIDVAQRSPCYRHSGNLDRALRVERNRFVDGQIKNEGNSEPETLNVFANNEFLNVNLQDYHQKWEAYYYLNTWLTNPFNGDLTSLKSYLWSQAALSPHVFHANTYGRMNFKGNLVRSNYRQNLMIYSQSTPFSSKKISSKHNVFLGDFANLFVQNSPITTDPTKTTDRRCHSYSDDGLYKYAASDADYEFRASTVCAGEKWTNVLNTVGKINNQNFGQSLGVCTTPPSSYRCLLNDKTSSYDSSTSYVADLNSGMTLTTPLEPFFANFRAPLGDVGQFLNNERFFHFSMLAQPKLQVSRDYLGRWRGFKTSPGSRDARFYGFWPKEQ